MSNVLKAKDDLLKTPEQLDQEKREIIAARTVKLNLEGKSKDRLVQDVTFAMNFFINSLVLFKYLFKLLKRLKISIRF
jgi:hypothetical protein